ncbi:hypothetical protein ECE50_012780 [Chitinophaga sp. Mgbs1]|uniref:Uncharacterized protein n=1 Tax=Chitinophaga solisilvae TaxID=1233460 RepID=A0A433W9K4_9BACT|nr:hypothetical protein [Chitinophaga solisilvae]
MKQPGHNVWPRLCAFFLLAVLVFIQAVKTTHRHDYAGKEGMRIFQQHNPSGCTISVAAHYCAICDYQLAKEVWQPSVKPSLLLQPSWMVAYASLHITPPQAFILHCANKGPPVA